MSRVEIIGDATLHLADYRDLEVVADVAVLDPPYGIDFPGYDAHRDDPAQYAALMAPLAAMPRAVLQYPEEMMRFLVPLWGPPDDVYAWCYESNLPRQFRLWGFWGVSPQWAALREPAKWAHLSKVSDPTRASHDWVNISQVKNTSADKTDHPCQAPLKLLHNVISFLPHAQTVFDPFTGSGTTGVACIALGRRFIGAEIDPKYFDIACKRIEEAWKQPRLFVEPQPMPVQETLGL